MHLRDGRNKRTSHYGLRGLLLAFQVWIYETISSFAGTIVTRMSKTQHRIMNWMTDEHTSVAKFDGIECFSKANIQICDLEPSDNEMKMLYMDGVWYIKPIQQDITRDGRRKKRRMESSVHSVGTSGEPGLSGIKMSTSVLMITDGSTGHAVVDEDGDDFVDPPRGGRRHLAM